MKLTDMYRGDQQALKVLTTPQVQIEQGPEKFSTSSRIVFEYLLGQAFDFPIGPAIFNRGTVIGGNSLNFTYNNWPEVTSFVGYYLVVSQSGASKGGILDITGTIGVAHGPWSAKYGPILIDDPWQQPSYAPVDLEHYIFNIPPYPKSSRILVLFGKRFDNIVLPYKGRNAWVTYLANETIITVPGFDITLTPSFDCTITCYQVDASWDGWDVGRYESNFQVDDEVIPWRNMF